MSLEKELKKIDGQKIIVVGDVGLDEYVNGAVKRISPEAPVPVVEVNKEEIRLGLATFVAQNIKTLGGEPLLVSVVGQDTTADVLRGLLKENEIDDKFLVVDSSRPTIRKMRVMSDHHHVVRIDYEKRKFLTNEIQNRVIKNVKELAGESDGIIIQDYAKGVLSENCIQEIIKIAREKKIFVVIDPHRTTPLEFYRGADLMTPNYEEALALSKIQLDEIHNKGKGLGDVGQALMKATGAQKMIITQGKEGMTLFDGKEVTQIPTFARDVFDVTGAGDTVIATLALAWASGVSLKDACYLANHAAGVVVGKIGCLPCYKEELLQSIEMLG